MKNNFFLLASLAWATGCTLTADDVEPALPTPPVLGTNTVVYRLNGLPVVAHNYGSVLTSVFGGNRYPPVDVFFDLDSSLVVRSADEQNERRPGYVTHELEWVLPRFRGLGRYQPNPAKTTFRLLVRDNDNRFATPGPQQFLDSQKPAEVIVTKWDSTKRQVSGTFVLHFTAQNGAPAAALTEGAFDLKPSF